MKSLTCNAEGCDHKATGATDEEVMSNIRQHNMEAHGASGEMSEEEMAVAKARIVDEPEEDAMSQG